MTYRVVFADMMQRHNYPQIEYTGTKAGLMRKVEQVRKQHRIPQGIKLHIFTLRETK